MSPKLTVRLSEDVVYGLACALPTLIYMVPFSEDSVQHRAFVELREVLRKKGVHIEETEPYDED